MKEELEKKIKKSFEKIKRDVRAGKDIEPIIDGYSEFSVDELNTPVSIPSIIDSETPLWLMTLICCEVACKKQSYEDQIIFITNYFESIKGNVEYLEFGNSSYTLRLCTNNYWACAFVIVENDPLSLTSEFPISMACIVNTSKKDIKYKASNMLKIIIDLGYNINKATPKYGHTALMKASSICDVPSLEIILKSNVNINQVDKNFNACAWMHALESEYGLGSTYTRDETFKVVKLLIDAGAGLMMTSTNQKDFPTFVTKCKQLNKSEKDKLRAIFIRVKGAKEATEHRKICRNKTVGAIDIIPEEYIAKYHGLTDFLLMPKNVVVHEILCLFCRFGIKEFYVKDVLNIINRTVKKWNDYKPTFTVTTVEDQLDYFVDFSKQMNLSKNPDLSYRIVMIEEKLSTESNILQMTKMFKELFEDKDE